MADIAERASAGAFIAHDHEGCRALTEALANVGARCLFTHGHELVAAQDILDFVEAGVGTARANANPFRLFERFTRHNFDGDTRDLVSRFLLCGGVVGFGGLGHGQRVVVGSVGCFKGQRETGEGTDPRLLEPLLQARIPLLYGGPLFASPHSRKG